MHVKQQSSDLLLTYYQCSVLEGHQQDAFLQLYESTVTRVLQLTAWLLWCVQLLAEVEHLSKTVERVSLVLLCIDDIDLCLTESN